MHADDRLRLLALDSEDLDVVSAHVQDAVLKVSDIDWRPAEKRLALALNRFVWEAGPQGRGFRKTWQRRRAILHFERVESVQASGIDQADGDRVLDLLAVRFDPREAPSGVVRFVFAGGADMKADVEVLEAQLTDLGPAWSTTSRPKHRV